MKRFIAIFSVVFLQTLTYANDRVPYGPAKTQFTSPTYLFTGSFDNQINPLFHSQQVSSDVMLSTAYGFAWLDDQLALPSRLHPVPAYCIAMLYRSIVGLSLGIINHELSHVLRGQEFDAKIKDFILLTPKPIITQDIPDTLNFFRLKLGGNVSLYPTKEKSYFQKLSAVLLNGSQGNRFFSQKIVWQLLTHRQQLHPLIAAFYIPLALDSLINNLLKIHQNKFLDMRRHENTMLRLYGQNKAYLPYKKATPPEIWLDLVDSMLFTSFYSVITNKSSPIPLLSFGDFKRLGHIRVMPVTQLIFTPYNAKEYYLMLYCAINEQIVKLTLGFGKEKKSTKPLLMVSDKMREILFQENKNLMRAGTHPDTGLYSQKDIPTPEHYTYYLGLDIDRFYQMGNFTLGLTLAAWRQPQLLTAKPINAPMKIGGMGLIKLNYQINRQFSGFIEAGGKTNGFTLGYPLESTGLLRGGITWMV